MHDSELNGQGKIEVFHLIEQGFPIEALMNLQHLCA